MEKFDNHLKLLKVSKKYGDSFVLKGIDFELSVGEMVCITGESGIGKTTILNIINLLENYTEGDYYINGIHVNDLTKRDINSCKNKIFGRIFQEMKLIDTYTVFENIEVPLLYAKPRISSKNRRQIVEECVKKFHLNVSLDENVSHLSGGEKQRVAIIRGIVNDQQIILADEFSSALDSDNRDFIINIFKQLTIEGRSIIVVTHDLNIVGEFNSHYLLKEEGLIKIN